MLLDLDVSGKAEGNARLEEEPPMAAHPFLKWLLNEDNVVSKMCLGLAFE